MKYKTNFKRFKQKLQKIIKKIFQNNFIDTKLLTLIFNHGMILIDRAILGIAGTWRARASMLSRRGLRKRILKWQGPFGGQIRTSGIHRVETSLNFLMTS